MSTIDAMDPTVPAGVWEQTGPIGGADPDGRLPRAAVPVVVQGVTVTRTAPVLRHIAGSITGIAGQSLPLVGFQPQRRWLMITTTVPFRLCDSRDQAIIGVGMLVQANQPLTINSAGPVFVRFEADGEIGYIAGMDEG